MIYAIDHVLLLHIFESLPHHGPVAILDHSGEFHRSQRPELLLDLREGELDGIVFRTVGHIEDASELESGHLRPGLHAAVGREVVHEEGDLLIWVQLPQFLEVLLELLDVDRVIEDAEVLLPLLLGDGGEDSQSRLLEVGQISLHF